MATDKKKFARPSDSMIAQLKGMIQKYGPKAKVYDPDALEAARAAVKEPQNYGADEFRIIMADLKAAAAQNFAVEDNFYFKGKKEKFAARLINTLKDDKSGRVAKVYRDPEWNEYVVKFYENGTYHSKADFFTDNKEDANGTASMWIQGKFARSGAKAKFAYQPEITNEIRRHELGIRTAEENLRSASKEGKWAVAQSFCNQAKNHYAALADLYSQLARLVTNPRKGI